MIKLVEGINHFPQSKPCLSNVIYSSGIFQTSSLIPTENIALRNQESQWSLTVSRTHGQKLLIFQHSRKPFLGNLQNHEPCNEVTPCVLLIQLLQSMWKLSITKPNISHPLLVSSRLEMSTFTFIKRLLQSRPKFS